MAKVLVAEDDNLTRHFLKQALEFGGHDVVGAADGAEAIAYVDRPAAFDAVITDFAMPRATGIDVVAHVHRVDPLIACIIVTAFRDLDLAMQAMAEGAVAFVPKPCKTEYLNTVLASALERRELAAEAMRLRTLAPMLERFTMVLANTIESKDAATQRHANRLVELSQRVAERVGVSGDLLTAIRYGACLHDIGKIAVPEHILRKPGPLTDEERATIRLHAEIGAVMLEGIDTWDDVRGIIRHHHERFDGRGYPDGLSGERIPCGARIVGVVDAFDVMRSGRPYAAARPLEQIHEELLRERGRQFDPEMVDALIAITSEEPPPAVIEAVPRQLIEYGALRSRADAAISGWLVAEVGAGAGHRI